jgi:hypothetical protein
VSTADPMLRQVGMLRYRDGKAGGHLGERI